MSLDTLVSLIETRLQTWAESEDIAIAFEGVLFKPPANANYARVKHLPSTTQGEFLDGRHKALTGLWQVSLVCVKGKGTGAGRRLADSLGNYFPQNLILTKGAFSLTITSPLSPGPWIEDPATAQTSSATTARMTLPCSFIYRADIVS